MQGTRGDAEVVAATATSTAWADAARAQVPLLGASSASVDDVLGRPARSRFLTAWADLAGVSVDAAVGARSLREREAGVRRLPVQATGQADATVHPRPASAGDPVVVR